MLHISYTYTHLLSLFKKAGLFRFMMADRIRWKDSKYEFHKEIRSHLIDLIQFLSVNSASSGHFAL